MQRKFNGIADELVAQLRQQDVFVRKTYDHDLNVPILDLGQYGSVRITDSVKNKWKKHRFEVSKSYNAAVKLKIEKGSVYYQIPVQSYQWIVDFIAKEHSKNYLAYGSAIYDMAARMRELMDNQNMLVSVQQKRDGIYLKGTYETVRVSDTAPANYQGFDYDLRQDKTGKSIQKDKRHCYTVDFNHYNWIIDNMSHIYNTKVQYSVYQVAENLKNVLLKENIMVREQKSTSTNSIYLHLDHNMLGTIRISDHKTHDKHNKYDICSQYYFVGKGKRTDGYAFAHYVPIEKWETVIDLVKKDRNHKLKKYGETGYNFKLETQNIV